MPPSRRPASPARRRGFVFSSLLLILALLAVLAGLATAAAVAIIYPQLPPLDELTHYQPRQPLQVLTREGIEIAQFGSERREFLPLAQIPQRMQDILVAVEDVRFREHGGIDYRGIARALLANLAGRREGASTITQQVARNFYLSSRRTVERKLKEAALALKIEQQLSKDQILELYMNQIYLGQRAYGFGAAARVYFGKPLAECSLAEMAMLAGLPKNPSFANPITHLERASARQRVVLGRALATGTISQAEHDAAAAQKLVLRSQGQTDVHAEHVAEMARREVFARLGDKAYTTGVKVHTSLVAAEQQAAWAALRKSLLEHERRQPWRGPEDEVALPDDADDAAIALALKDSRDDEDLRVAIVLQASPRELTARLANGDTVTLNGEGLRLALSGLGPKASEALRLQRGSIIRVAATAKGGWAIAQWPEAEGALVALDSASGRVRALVGGYDFARQPFNHATQAWRQPGSSFKPLLYSAALEQGVMPATRINDAPLTIGDWSPQNSDGQFDGPLTLRQALAKSKNLVSVRLLQQIGVPAARNWVERFGLARDKQPDNLTLALGAGSVTPMQMAAAYAVFANGGFKVTPRVIEKIVDAQGTVLFEAPAAPVLAEPPAVAASAAASAAEPASAPIAASGVSAPPAPVAAASAADGERVIPARNAFVTRALLQEVTRSGTAARAQAMLKRPDLYGKTGTTNDAVDAWFAGFQPGIVAVVWVGYDEPRSLGARESGGGLALPAWLGYMQQALKSVPVAADPPPQGVDLVEGDWRYAEWAAGGFVERIGVEADPPPPAASAASAASAP